jgi:hypothetical protein
MKQRLSKLRATAESTMQQALKRTSSLQRNHPATDADIATLVCQITPLVLELSSPAINSAAT